MVVKMLRWPPWPPLSSRKFEVKVIIQKLQGLKLAQFESNENGGVDSSKNRLVIEVKWKGEKGIALGVLKRSVKRNFTEEGGFCGDGTFEWNEEFSSVCNLSGYKDGVFVPWEIACTVLNCFTQEPGSKVLMVGTATLNLAEYASLAKEKELQIDVPLVVSSTIVEASPSLHLCLKLVELITVQEPPQAVQSSLEPISRSLSRRQSPQKDDLSGLKAGLRRIQIFGVAKKAFQEEEHSDVRCCAISKNAEYNYPFDTDSVDDTGEDTDSNDSNSNAQISINHETLAYANFSRGLQHLNALYLNAMTSAEDDDWIYYKNHKKDIGFLTESVNVQSSEQKLKRRILPWTKRKLSFKSNKAKVKGEPLLKKDHQEDGGDDIDYDRRQLSSSDESSFGWHKSEEDSTTSRSSFSEFGDDNFAIGNWELKEVTSRDGHMKLQTQVFFASIDQRSERAAGESACTALVAVIAHWLQSNPCEVPIKSEFDSLIRDGSLEWRNLCANEKYMQQFPDKHFDLDTILEARVRPLSLVPEKSFIGFFHPEGLEDEDFDFLHGAMSFDSIWEEISREFEGRNKCGQVYILSWNDHFFILKVEQDAYYIIDTLGERLYEGCNQAYVLKFDKDAIIKQIPKETQPSEEKPAKEKGSIDASETPNSDEVEKAGMEEEIVCKGKESCKEYIKSFLAAIPLRELQADVKKGLRAAIPLHHRLQIEFHYTMLTPAADDSSLTDPQPAFDSADVA